MMHVINFVFEHGDTFDAHAEGEARIFLRIDAVGLQYVGVDHAAAQNLQPARALADRTALAAAEVARDVDLGRGFGEGEVRRTHPDGRLFAEEFFGEEQQRLFQVGERNPFVDVKSFDLVEKRGVCSINSI